LRQSRTFHTLANGPKSGVQLTNDHVQVQIWIGSDDHLPRQLWLTLTQAPQKPLRMTEFSDWKLGQPVDMTPPNTQGAETIDFGRQDDAEAKQQ
jgi:hypothetical protein